MPLPQGSEGDHAVSTVPPPQPPSVLPRLALLPKLIPQSIMAPNPEKSLGPWALLLLIPFVALLWVPFYNFSEPVLLGFPFFYWYQFLWVPISSLLIYIVYLKTR
jgi:Protein of unknown function (DUF3311)